MALRGMLCTPIVERTTQSRTDFELYADLAVILSKLISQCQVDRQG